MKIWTKSNKKKSQEINLKKRKSENSWILSDDQFKSILYSTPLDEKKQNNKIEELFSDTNIDN